jgi:hypothetical protein
VSLGFVILRVGEHKIVSKSSAVFRVFSVVMQFCSTILSKINPATPRSKNETLKK